MAFQELTVWVKAQDAEHVADQLLNLGALSVGIEDAYENSNAEEALFDEPVSLGNLTVEKPMQLWQHSLLRVLFSKQEKAAEQKLQQILLINDVTPFKIEQRFIPEQDWVKNVQVQFQTIVISDRLWIVPSWEQARKEVEHVISLDPGLAFGTGSHPTTYLCLQWLDQHLKPDSSVMDYGCGSGILAIAAKKLGAGKVVGVDIDPQAISASKENSCKNKVAIDYFLVDDFKGRTAFDLVIANILANPLRLLAELLVEKVACGGYLLLSGLLESQAQELIDCYRSLIPLHLGATKEGWAMLIGKKKAD